MSDTATAANGLLIKIRQGAETPVLESLKERLGADTQSKRLCPDLDWYQVRSKHVTDKPPGEVFETAHSLLDIEGILSLEPDLKISQNADQEFDEHRDRGHGPRATPETTDTDPATEGRYTWHIEQVKAGEARKQFSVTGAGVRVAHLDTGYTRHPELVIGTSVRADLGYNYYESRSDPLEPLETIQEGHGTATASVLVSLEGKQHQHPGLDAFVEGVSPGAELIPIRVDRDPYFIVSASCDVLGISHALKQNCHVISMSRGGPDFDILRDAVRLALSRGTVVVAAAANCNFGCGIWSPANYEGVVCVAGSTIGKTPWEGSSRGKEVTIGAPAYSVYRARAQKRNNSYAFDVAPSSGTSYSTPIVAGAAALWLQRHGGATDLARMLNGPERIAAAFKYLLLTSGFQIGIDWNTSEFGPGILDCVALLAASLPKSEDFTMIGNFLRGRSHASKRQLADRLLERKMDSSLDPRKRYLMSLEIEVATTRDVQLQSLLTFAAEGVEDRLRMDSTRDLAVAIAGQGSISPSLLAALHVLEG